MAAARALDALALLGVRLLASSVVWGSGFRAISDDDYARVVIAQRFSSAPTWDPSGTSWLPFPFWLQGIAMLPLGPSLDVARALALAQGCSSTLLVWLGALWLGLGRINAFIAAAAATLIPYSAWLGVATVPESLTAGFLIVGACSVASSSTHQRLWGAIAMLAATLSRYEAWPVALTFSLVCVWDAYRRRQTAPLAPALIAVSGAAAWMMHGALHHDSATFFVKRVADYQQALGQAADAWPSALVRYPLLALRHAPIVAALAAVGWLATSRLKPIPTKKALLRPLSMMAVLLAFLVSSDLRNAGATHHAERALLPLWYSWALVVGATWPPLATELQARLTRVQSTLASVVLALSLACMMMLRPAISQPAPFVDRHAELELGHRAREFVRTEQGRLLIDTADYGFFAVLAAFAAPHRAVVLDDHDPRHPRTRDPFEDPAAFRARLRRDEIQALIAPTAKLAIAQRFGTLVATSGNHALIAIDSKLVQ